jgi:hypothetical protein
MDVFTAHGFSRMAYPPRRRCVLVLLIVMLAGIFPACSDDDAAADPQAALLNTWALTGDGYIQKDDVDVSGEYQGLTISFQSNGVYTTTEGGDLFPATGTWKWADGSTSALVLDGSWAVTVSGLSTTHLQLSLTHDDGITSGRKTSLAGDYILSLYANH